MGSLLEITSPATETRRIYITGDTLIIDELQEIPRRFPEIDLALLHLGGTRVLGILVSMDALRGVEAMRIVDPALAIPIHYNDDDVYTSSLEEFLQAAQEAGQRERVHVLRHGDRYDFPARMWGIWQVNRAGTSRIAINRARISP
jgi:L-ascorbate metabolism protein UlaG (beta-lactamase superfamily)